MNYLVFIFVSGAARRKCKALAIKKNPPLSNRKVVVH